MSTKTPKGNKVYRDEQGRFCQRDSKPWDMKKSNVAGRRNLKRVKKGKKPILQGKGNKCSRARGGR